MHRSRARWVGVGSGLGQEGIWGHLVQYVWGQEEPRSQKAISRLFLIETIYPLP